MRVPEWSFSFAELLTKGREHEMRDSNNGENISV